MATTRTATDTLAAHVSGDPEAAADLLPLVYGELRRIAARYMQRERRGHTLQPTELVHEAYLRLIDLDRIDWHGRSHFLAMAARQMRRILVEHARRARSLKRRAAMVTLHDGAAAVPARPLDVLAVDEALERLAARSKRQSEVAELRFFAGMTAREIAHVLGVSERTVGKDWQVARAWLAHTLSERDRVLP